MTGGKAKDMCEVKEEEEGGLPGAAFVGQAGEAGWGKMAFMDTLGVLKQSSQSTEAVLVIARQNKGIPPSPRG